MAKTRVQLLREVASYIFSRQSIPVLKGTLAYVLAFVLIFLRDFENLHDVPIVLTNIMIVVIAGQPGKAVGACLQATALALLGVLVGSGCFVILAKLSQHSLIAQAVVFAIIVYVLALIKARGMRFFGFSLLAILMAFNGVAVSIQLGMVFSKKYLYEYLQTYAWGAAIVLFVNIFVFPCSSERELRQTLVTSLEHIGTFGHLLGKSYTLSLTEDEKECRDNLLQTIRADFGFLTTKIEETSIELNWSPFSLNDYQDFVSITRSLQQSLITAHSSLLGVDPKDIELFKRAFLPSTVTSFNRLRRDIDLTVRSLGLQLGCKPITIPGTQAGYSEFMDLETQRTTISGARGGTKNLGTEAPEPRDFAEQLQDISRRLELEVELIPETPRTSAFREGTTAVASGSQSPATTRAQFPTSGTESPAAIPTADMTEKAEESSKTSNPAAQADPGAIYKEKLSTGTSKGDVAIKSLRKNFDAFQNAQFDILTQVLVGGDLHGQDDILRIHEPKPSIYETFGVDLVGLEEDPSPTPVTPKLTARSTKSGTDSELRFRKGKETEKDIESASVDDDGNSQSSDSKSDKESTSDNISESQSLIRVYSFLFALNQFVEGLEGFHAALNPKNGRRKSKRFHFHVFESLRRPGQKQKATSHEVDQELTIREALCILAAKPYEPVHRNFWNRMEDVQKWFSSPDSLFAAKTSAAACVLGALIWADTTRSFFLSYGLTGSMITCIVALAPTLGQSLVTFVLQILGSGIGYLWGLAVLEMFRDVGGYRFNPYGIACMVAIYALPLQYLIYENPKFFVLALLALNGTGVLVVLEYVQVVHIGNVRFDSPALRTGKALAGLAIALAIVAVFQFFVLRNPARRTLRLALGKLVYANLSYNTILQAYVQSLLPADPNHRPTMAAVRRVERELKHRELKLQAEIIAMQPLLVFAAAEPHFGRVFRGDVASKIIRANQILLDRMREGRGAIGNEPFPGYIIRHFVSVLSPYRRRSVRVTKAKFYLCAASLLSKSPLPHDLPSPGDLLEDFIHDALLLSSRLVKEGPDGGKAVRSSAFIRYWFYILCVTSIPAQLKAIEEGCKELYGELEDDPKLH